MKKTTKVITLLLSLLILATAASCNGNNSQSTEETGRSIVPGRHINYDRAGNTIELPESISKIVSIGPSNTEVLVELGFADMIFATDEYSSNVPGLKPDISGFDMMANDGEQLILMAPEVIFVTGMSQAAGDDPYRVLADAGICLIYIPSSTSLTAIMEDILYIAEVLSVKEKGLEIVAEMEAEIAKIMEIADLITEKKKVYFEIGAAPQMYSFGQGTFLNEMIELVGAVNIFSDIVGWTGVSDETILDTNPDVILTTVNYIDNPLDEIRSRHGWGEVTAIKNDAVYYISTDASNRPSHNVVIAMQQIAQAVYPEYYLG